MNARSSLHASWLLLCGAISACAAPMAVHTSRSDCLDARRPPLPDGKSVMTCERDATGFHWTVSVATSDLAACATREVVLVGCSDGERGLVCIRSEPSPDAGYAHFDWHPVCR